MGNVRLHYFFYTRVHMIKRHISSRWYFFISLVLLLGLFSSRNLFSGEIDTTSESEIYLVIVADKYQSSPSLDRFVSFRSKEFDVQTVIGSNIGTTKDDFRDYVRSVMPCYVLLVGDYGDFPTHVVGYNNAIESYNYYVASSLTGHPRPDIPLGLFLVESEEELGNIVTKTIYTENNISSYPREYYAHAGSNEPLWPWSVEFNEELLTEMYDRYFINEGYNFTLATALDDTPNDAWTDIRMINRGIKYLIYHGHGQIHKWVFGLGVGGLPQLKNDIFPFVFSFSCSTGTFSGEVNGQSRDCFAKKMVASEYGAVAFFGAYNISGRGMNPLLEGTVNGLFNHEVNNRLGDILIYAFNNTTNPNTVNQYYPVVTELERTRSAWQFHLFGDPALLIDALKGDLNGDKRIDFFDFTIMSLQWQQNADDLVADIDRSGAVDIIDLSYLAENWLGQP
jgi:hypothetical protein